MSQMKKCRSIFHLTLSIFSCVLFVACGEGFKVKSQNNLYVTETGAGVSFKPTVQIQKTFAGEYDGYKLTFLITDPQVGKTIYVSTIHNHTQAVAAYVVDGNYSYHVTAICFSPDYSCNDVGALVYRSSEHEVHQTALRATGAGMSLAVVKQENGAAYDSVEGVYFALPY